MAQAFSDRADTSRAEQALALSLRAMPRATSANLGWEGIRVCNWWTRVHEYQLPAVPEFIVALHTSGQGVERAGGARGKNSRSLPGQGTIRPPGLSDIYRPHGPFRCTTAHVSIPRVLAIAEAIGHRSPVTDLPCRFGINDPLLTSLLTTLAREVESPAQYSSLLADRLVDALIVHVLRGPHAPLTMPSAGRLSPAALARVRARIEDCLALPVAVADLAAEARLSPFHFSRAFKQTTGQSPHRYLTERRIERAKSLLQSGDLPISVIALESGFTSQQHFTGIFRRFTGTPPAAYRRSFRAEVFPSNPYGTIQEKRS